MRPARAGALGHAAGKTTCLRASRTRRGSRPGVPRTSCQRVLGDRARSCHSRRSAAATAPPRPRSAARLGAARGRATGPATLPSRFGLRGARAATTRARRQFSRQPRWRVSRRIIGSSSFFTATRRSSASRIRSSRCTRDRCSCAIRASPWRRRVATWSTCCWTATTGGKRCCRKESTSGSN